MKYNIDYIKKDTSIKGVFFFDTMIWLNIIAPTFNKDEKYIKYTNFFDKIFKQENTKIAVSSLLFSEIINLYLKRIALPLYEQKMNTKVHFNEYKTKYRPTKHYKEHYAIVCDELESRINSFEFTEDPLSTYDILNIPKYPKLDFNDFNYYQICKNNGFTLVTDDSDFFINDIQILTLNQGLYKKQFNKY